MHVLCMFCLHFHSSPRIKILSLFIHPHIILNPCAFHPVKQMKHHRSVIKVVYLTAYNTYFVKIELRPKSGLLDYDLSCVRWVWLDHGQIQNQSQKKKKKVIFLNFSVGIVSLLCEFNCYSL